MTKSSYSLRVKVIAAIVVLVISIAILELGVRFAGIAPDIDIVGKNHMSDPYLPWKIKPNVVTNNKVPDGPTFEYRYNSLGFRDEEHPLVKPDNTFRIMALGDSFTHGSAARYEDTYLVRLEKMLNQRTGGNPQIEILKMGIGGFWTEPERILLEKYGLEYDPDLVIVGFLKNDVIDTQKGFHRKLVRDGYIISKDAGAFGQFGLWLFVNSHFVRTILSHYVTWLKSKTPYMEWEPAWAKVLDEFGKIIQLSGTTTTSAKTVIFHISQKKWADHGMEDHQIRLKEFCESAGCFFIDSVPELRKHPDPQSLYWPIDGHCTGEGYGVMAEALFKGLVENRLVP